MQNDGLQQVFEDHRGPLLRYLRAHGAGDAAEDCLQELWLKVSATPTGPIASPRNYLFRAATNLMIDRRRAEAQASRRDHEWSGAGRSAGRLGRANDPGPERELDAPAQAARWSRPSLARFRRARWRSFASIASRAGPSARSRSARGLSASTIESDLRLAYRLLDDIRERLDEE